MTELITKDMQYLLNVGDRLQRPTIDRRTSFTAKGFQHVKDLQAIITEKTGRAYSTQQVINLIIESHAKLIEGAL